MPLGANKIRPVYTLLDYRGFAFNLEDSTTRLVCADWLEDSQEDSEYQDYADYLRQDPLVPEQLAECSTREPLTTETIFKPARDIDYGWQEAFGYGGDTGASCVLFQCAEYKDTLPTSTPPNLIEDVPNYPIRADIVKRVIKSKEGENDGDEWLIVGELWDGRFFSLRAWCDYTGWD